MACHPHQHIQSISANAKSCACARVRRTLRAHSQLQRLHFLKRAVHTFRFWVLRQWRIEQPAGVQAREQSQQTVAQSEFNKVLTANKKLERQKADLLAAFKRQMKLVDVLKRQKVHIEAARMLQFTEDEFLQVLEMPASSVNIAL